MWDAVITISLSLTDSITTLFMTIVIYLQIQYIITNYIEESL